LSLQTRRVARFIVVNPQSQVLLFQFRWPTGEFFWATPGGGLEEGETFEQAAAREAAEELGMNQITLAPLWEDTSDFLFEGRPIHQIAKFYLLRVQQIDFTRGVLEQHRREGIHQIRWWSVADLEATNDPVYPEELAERVRGIVGGRP
jgi:ADP-ribose pyrophosphatase YjhB (NUDIX family)